MECSSSLQVFARCGSFGTVVLQAFPRDTFEGLKHQLCDRYPELGLPADLSVFYRGRLWHNGCTLSRARIRGGATLDVQGRLRGGGGDGGSTGAESRDCYLEMYATKKKDKVNPAEEKLAKWTMCHLTGQPLSPPCCADELGNLFNKDAVVRALVAKSLPKSLPHITSLNSLTNLKLERNPHASARGAAAANQFQPGNEAEWVCPVTGLHMNGRFCFVALRPSGLVVSEKALKEARTAVEELVGGPVDGDSVLVLNPEGEQLEAARARVLLRLAAKVAKKGKKRGGEKAGADDNGKGKKAKAAAVQGSEVYRSIFLDASRREKETYCCRATSARGMNLT